MFSLAQVLLQATLPCTHDDGAYAACRNVLTICCPPEYELNTLLGIRSKESGKKCTWIAGYTYINNESIPDHLADAAGRKISAVNPACAVAKLIGRACFEESNGMFVKWVRNNCMCGPFFDVTMPPLHTNRGKFISFDSF